MLDHVVTGIFSLVVPNPAVFVARPESRSLAAASIARLAQVSVDRVLVELQEMPARRLSFLAAAEGSVNISYIIRVLQQDAVTMASGIRSTTVAVASQVFSEEFAREVGSSPIAAALPTIIVIAITAHAPPPSPTLAATSGQEAKSGFTPTMIIVVISSIMGLFCCIQLVPCACNRFHPLREMCAGFCGVCTRDYREVTDRISI